MGKDLGKAPRKGKQDSIDQWPGCPAELDKHNPLVSQLWVQGGEELGAGQGRCCSVQLKGKGWEGELGLCFHCMALSV